MNERNPSDNGCKEFAELISAYFDGQLSDAQVKAVEAHLASCPRCAARLDDYKLFRSLMNAEQQENPIDLNSAVMAGVEREQLLDGLDLMTKPPTSRWVKVVRALSVAAMLGVIIGTAFFMLHINNFSKKTGQPENNRLTWAINEKTAEPAGSFGTQGKLQKGSALVSDENKNNFPAADSSALQSRPAAKAKMVDSSISMFRAPRTPATMPSQSIAPVEALSENSTPARGGSFARSLPETQKVEMKKESIQPNRPLVLQPSAEVAEATATTQPRTGKIVAVDASPASELAWPIPLVYRFTTPDMPAWMMLKEQILSLLEESDVSSIQEHSDVEPLLAAGDEFFYVAKKGLDLPPGPLRGQILLIVSPAKFLRIYNLLQVSVSDTVVQTLSPALKTLVKDGRPAPVLAGMAERSISILRKTFPLPMDFDVSSQAASAPKATSPASVPATRQEGEFKTLPVLIIIEIRAKNAIREPATLPATQPTSWLSDDMEE